jgi:hypothetical protein
LASRWRGSGIEISLGDPPSGPHLPLAIEPERIVRPRFTRRVHRLASEACLRIRERAQQPGLTPATTLATAPPNGRELIATPCRPVRPQPHVPDVQDAMEGRGDGCRCT